MIPIATVLPLFRDAGRPLPEGATKEVVAGRFKIHYAAAGPDAPEPEDVDGNGLPDRIDILVENLPAAERSYAEAGWRPLLDDDGTDGPQIDVYVRRLDIFGYATAVPTPAGASCYLQIDPVASDGGVLASVAWHELHHCVQFRYTTTTASWLYESTSTFHQYSLVDDEALDYGAGLLWYEWLGAPERVLGSIEGRREYASFVFSKFWVERGREADPTRLQRVWEALAEPEQADEGADWIPTLDRAAREEWGIGLDDVFAEHLAWNLFACAGDDGAHYDPDVIPCISAVTVDVEPFVEGERIAHVFAPYTGAYRLLEPEPGPVRVLCDGDGEVRLVARDAAGAEADADAGKDAQVTVPEGGNAVLVLAGTADGPLDLTCGTAEPRAEELRTRRSFAGGCTTAPGPASLVVALAVALGLRRRR